ncbi:hypothetical protein Droror1_Dr00023121 [Drosera rotundifolia]
MKTLNVRSKAERLKQRDRCPYHDHDANNNNNIKHKPNENRVSNAFIPRSGSLRLVPETLSPERLRRGENRGVEATTVVKEKGEERRRGCTEWSEKWWWLWACGQLEERRRRCAEWSEK